MSFFSPNEIADFKENKEPGPAAKYVCEEWFGRIHTAQVTLPRNPNGDYGGILNEAGTRLLEKTREDAARGVFKDSLHEFSLVPSPSSRFFDSRDAWTESYNNIFAHGRLASTGEMVEMSTIVLYYANWLLTASGSLYRLDKVRPDNSDALAQCGSQTEN